MNSAGAIDEAVVDVELDGDSFCTHPVTVTVFSLALELV
jgi:hypothetical protein